MTDRPKPGTLITDDDAIARARRAFARELPPKFYKSADMAETPEGFEILLDGRTVKTPARATLRAPNAEAARAVTAEWMAQDERVDPDTMPMTRLLNAVIDAVSANREAVADEVAAYGETDLLCYRADEPEGLVALQNEHWNPVLSWAEREHGLRFVMVAGIMHQPQPEETLKAIRNKTAALDDFRLGAVASMAGLTGSALLALAVAEGHLSDEQAWAAAHVDEDWQISLWGEDAEAALRRRKRWGEMQAAALLCRS